MTDGADLDRLAELVGIEPFYHDIWGNPGFVIFFKWIPQ